MMAKKKTEEEIAETEVEEQQSQNEETQEQEQENELEKKCNELNEKYMRVLAEYDNYRKRTIKEKESIYPEAKATVVAKFLDVMDNFERALNAAENKDSFYEGVVMVKKQMDEVLSSLGVEEIKAVGEEFNPVYHNAVMHTEDENLGENIVAQELQKGYKMGDRVIRHSMVQVAN